MSNTSRTKSLNALRERLIRLQESTRRQILEFRHKQEEESQVEPGDLLDRAHANEEIETRAALISEAQERFRKFDKALLGFEHGTYGTCIECTRQIPLERLRALPFTARCVECQEKADREWRSAEGAMPKLYDHQWTMPDEMDDAENDDQAIANDERLSIRIPLKEKVSGRKLAFRPTVAIRRRHAHAESSMKAHKLGIR